MVYRNFCYDATCVDNKKKLRTAALEKYIEENGTVELEDKKVKVDEMKSGIQNANLCSEREKKNSQRKTIGIRPPHAFFLPNFKTFFS